MTTFLFLFHSTVGVVRMRKALQAAGVAFEVKDIPRQLRSGCGLCILLEGTEADARGWIVPEQTAALYQQNGKHGAVSPPSHLQVNRSPQNASPRNSSAGGA